MASLMSRLRESFKSAPAPQTMALTAPVQDTPKRLLDEKASATALLPRGAYGENYVYFSPDGGRTTIPIDMNGHVAHTSLAFVAYWYVAIRWRAQKIAEAPLMVVEEDQDDGSEEWISDHDLVPVLEQPSEDYDMGELLERTSMYLDNTGAALWVFDMDSAGLVLRITPFDRTQFKVEPDATRLYATFTVETSQGEKDFDASEVAYFRDIHDAWGNTGRSKLQMAMQALRLGERAMSTIYDLLNNSIWPSGVVTTHQDWNPSKELYDEFKQDLNQYSKRGNKGKPFVALGGGSFVPLQSAIKDLVPEDVLNRVESIVSAISGVPAIVLQFQVGMENSPWSQMEQARRMAYDDTIIPAWAKIERILTSQMLRPVDDDQTHFIRFDASGIASLREDQLTQVQIATTMGRAASLNERRKIMGLEPVDDPKADEIPELTQPSLQDILAGNAGGGDGGDSTDAEDDPKDAPKKKGPPDEATKRQALARKFQAPALQDALRQDSLVHWTITVNSQLNRDAKHIARIVEQTLIDTPKSNGRHFETKARGKDRVMELVTGYLDGESKQSWARATTPLMVQAAERSTAVIAADLGISFTSLNPSIQAFAKKHTANLVGGVSKTTRSLVSDIIEGGIDAGASTSEIATLLREATGFSKSRSELIARTETTRAFNGAPQDSLSDLAERTGRIFTKTWSGILDDRERDEHVAMEGEEVGINEEFSNGLLFPDEPNCRCTVLYNEQEG